MLPTIARSHSKFKNKPDSIKWGLCVEVISHLSNGMLSLALVRVEKAEVKVIKPLI